LSNLLRIEFSREVGHPDVVLLEHMTDPHAEMLVGMRPHICLVKGRGLFFLAERNAKRLLEGQSRRVAI
jgi:hypothetical protein